MTKVAIIGAGQAGLQLAIALLKNNIEVTLLSNRSADEIKYGSITSSQAIFHTALQHERELGLNYWDDSAPVNTSISFSMSNAEQNFKTPALKWIGHLNHPFQSVDQRLKFPAWLNEFETLGGNLLIQNVDISAVDELSLSHDLVIISTGKGSLSDKFKKNNLQSPFDVPMRSLALIYVTNMKPNQYPGVSVNMIPGVGEYFTMPGLGLYGPCEMMLFEGIIGGTMDCWNNILSPNEQLQISKKILEKYLPWEAERCQHIQLADEKATLRGSYAPIVREPILELPSGKLALGIADAIALNDPVAGQGANNASRFAKIYHTRIVKNKDKSFSKEWMLETFNICWSYTKLSTKWSNMLLMPPAPHVQELLISASHNQSLANRIANGFDDLTLLFPWVEDKDATKAIICTYSSNNYNAPNKNHQDNKNKLKQASLKTLLDENKKCLNIFRNTPLMQLIYDNKLEDEIIRTRLLDSIQLFSDHFQQTVLLRHALTESETYKKITNTHLDEEYGHNNLLLRDRANKPPIKDSILEATTTWFTWKMLTLDNLEKNVLVHLVLESSANLFFKEVAVVMHKYDETNYFQLHADVDECHENMGVELLEQLRENEYHALLQIQKEGWDMLITACNRIAELASQNVKKHEEMKESA